MSDEVICPQCGTKKTTSSKFCSNCGFTLKGTAPSSVPVTQDNTLNKPLLTVGVVGCGIQAIWVLIVGLIIGLIVGIFNPGLIQVSRYITNYSILLVIAGQIALINLLPAQQDRKYLLYALFAGISIIYFITPFTSLYASAWSPFVLRILLAIPPLLLYYFYWKFDVLLARILLIVRIVRVFYGLLLTGLSFAPSINLRSLYIINSLLTIASVVILGIWFVQLLQQPESQVVQPSGEHIAIPSSPTAKAVSTSGSLHTGVSSGYVKSQGLNRTLPALIFWCETCGKQVKGLQLQSMKKEDVEIERQCPECNSTVKAWWLPPNQARYIRFVMGLSLFGGSVIVFAISNAFGFVGVIPYVLATLCLIGAIAVNWNMVTRNFNIEGPPPHATTIPSAEPGQEFLKEVVIVCVLALIGASIVFGIIVGISAAIASFI